MNEDIFETTRDPIDKRAREQRLHTCAAGAVVTFDGTVRVFQTGFDVLVQRKFISRSCGPYER